MSRVTSSSAVVRPRTTVSATTDTAGSAGRPWPTSHVLASVSTFSPDRESSVIGSVRFDDGTSAEKRDDVPIALG